MWQQQYNLPTTSTKRNQRCHTLSTPSIGVPEAVVKEGAEVLPLEVAEQTEVAEVLKLGPPHGLLPDIKTFQRQSKVYASIITLMAVLRSIALIHSPVNGLKSHLIHDQNHLPSDLLANLMLK